VTDPSRAYVWKQDQTGKRTVGRSPTWVEHRYEVEVRKASNWWWIGIGGVAAASYVGGALAGTESDLGTALLYAASATTLVALIGYYMYGRYAKELPRQPEPVTLGASLDGYLDQKITLQVPGPDKQARLVLPPDPDRPVAVKTYPSPQPRTVPVARTPQGTVVAVFDIQDSSKKFSHKGLDQLTEYLVARLTQVTRYRVIPRDQLRDRLVTEKKGSHRKCFEESCQIEMGKALAAQKSLATKILRVGKRCAITSTLYDLKTETAEKSALSRTECSDDALMDAMDRVARQLSGSDYR
jgi:hypothetical protein